MVQIFNLKTIGEKKYSEVFETLKNYTDLLNSDYGIPCLTIKQSDSDVIKIDSRNTYYVWNFIADFNLKDSELIIKSICDTGKMAQTVWMTNKKVDFRKNIDLIIQLQNKDIEQFFTDYLSVLEDRFPNNFDLEDLFLVTKNKKLRYDRYTIPNENLEDGIKTFFNNQLNWYRQYFTS